MTTDDEINQLIGIPIISIRDQYVLIEELVGRSVAVNSIFICFVRILNGRHSKCVLSINLCG